MVCILEPHQPIQPTIEYLLWNSLWIHLPSLADVHPSSIHTSPCVNCADDVAIRKLNAGGGGSGGEETGGYRSMPQVTNLEVNGPLGGGCGVLAVMRDPRRRTTRAALCVEVRWHGPGSNAGQRESLMVRTRFSSRFRLVPPHLTSAFISTSAPSSPSSEALHAGSCRT